MGGRKSSSSGKAGHGRFLPPRWGGGRGPGITPRPIPAGIPLDLVLGGSHGKQGQAGGGLSVPPKPAGPAGGGSGGSRSRSKQRSPSVIPGVERSQLRAGPGPGVGRGLGAGAQPRGLGRLWLPSSPRYSRCSFLFLGLRPADGSAEERRRLRSRWPLVPPCPRHVPAVPRGSAGHRRLLSPPRCHG